jgi:hypothetical protein
MKSFWKLLFTGILCIVVLGIVSLFGFELRKKIPWLTAATVVVDGGIVAGFYKIILDTLKAANELQKTGLEIEKLRREQAEKERTEQKENARIVAPTFEQIEKCSKLATPRRWAMRGTLLLIVCTVGAVSSLLWTSHQVPLAEKLYHKSPNVETSPADHLQWKLPPAFRCETGTLFITDRNILIYESDSIHEAGIRVIIPTEGQVQSIVLTRVPPHDKIHSLYSSPPIDSHEFIVNDNTVFAIEKLDGTIITRCIVFPPGVQTLPY